MPRFPISPFLPFELVSDFDIRISDFPASQCDIAWAGALATHAHIARRCEAGAAVVHEHGNVIYEAGVDQNQSNLKRMLLSDDPAIWKPFNF